MKLNVKAFTLAFGILWGAGLFLLTWWMIMLYGATGETTLIGRIYYGYNMSPSGSLIGLAWGFIDGAIFGLLLSLIYNALTDRMQ